MIFSTPEIIYGRQFYCVSFPQRRRRAYILVINVSLDDSLSHTWEALITRKNVRANNPPSNIEKSFNLKDEEQMPTLEALFFYELKRPLFYSARIQYKSNADCIIETSRLLTHLRITSVSPTVGIRKMKLIYFMFFVCWVSVIIIAKKLTNKFVKYLIRSSIWFQARPLVTQTKGKSAIDFQDITLDRIAEIVSQKNKLWKSCYNISWLNMFCIYLKWFIQ
jgi:hypothetical protein